MRWIEDERLAIALGNQVEDDGNVLKIAAPEKLRCIAKRGEREGVQKVAELAPREPVHSESAATITRSRVVHSPTTHYIERFQPQGTKYTLPVRAGNADSLFDLAICECSPIVPILISAQSLREDFILAACDVEGNFLVVKVRLNAEPIAIPELKRVWGA